LYDVSGSADFRNQTHDGFCIYRNFGEDSFTTFTNLKTKYSFQGTIGEIVEFDYHKPSGRYYERGTNPQEENLIDSNKQKNEVEENSLIEEIAPFPLIKMEELKGVFDDLPYNDEDEVPF